MAQGNPSHTLNSGLFSGCPRSESSGWLRNRTGTGNRNRRNRFSRNRKRNRRNRFPGTETGTGTVPFLLNCTETQKNPFCRGTAGTENRNRLNRSIPKPYNRTEPKPGTIRIMEDWRSLSALLQPWHHGNCRLTYPNGAN